MQKSMNCFECLKSRFIYKKQFFVHNLRVWNEFDPHMSLLDLRKRHRHLQNGMVIHFGLWLWDFHRIFYIIFFKRTSFVENMSNDLETSIFFFSWLRRTFYIPWSWSENENLWQKYSWELFSKKKTISPTQTWLNPESKRESDWKVTFFDQS